MDVRVGEWLLKEAVARFITMGVHDHKGVYRFAQLLVDCHTCSNLKSRARIGANY